MNIKLKIKHKKRILMISLGTMVIGLAALSLARPSGESIQTSGAGQKVESSKEPEKKLDVVETELKQNAHKEINEIVKKYFTACQQADITTLHTIVSEVENISEEAIKKKYEYIEDVKNIECYTIDGPDEGSQIVYVYYEYKFKDIDTLAPGMSRLYVCKADDDRLVILLSQLDDQTEKVLNESTENKQVKELVDTVDKKLVEAMTSDAKLKAFVDGLNQPPAPTEQPKATAKPSAAPTGQPKASAKPSAAPTGQPKSTAKPSAAPKK